jgi:hypothetical protein
MLTIVNKESAQLIDDIISFIKERKRKQPFKVSTQDIVDKFSNRGTSDVIFSIEVLSNDDIIEVNRTQNIDFSIFGKRFTEKGSYLQMSQENEQQIQFNESREFLEFRKLEMEVENLENMPKRIKKANRRAWIAIIISIIAVLWTIISTLLTDK